MALAKVYVKVAVNTDRIYYIASDKCTNFKSLLQRANSEKVLGKVSLDLAVWHLLWQYYLTQRIKNG